MMPPLQVVAVVGSTSTHSRTLLLARSVLQQLELRLHLETHVIELAQIARPLGAALTRDDLPSETEQQLQRIESADLLVVAVPVFRGSYPGLFKHLFDLISVDALIDTPVLIAANGGTERHTLMLDYQLRPLFSFLQALTLPIGVYASPADFDGRHIVRTALSSRIALAAERAAGVVKAISVPRTGA